MESTQKCPDSVIQHLLGQPSREGVLLAGMIAREDLLPRIQLVDRAVPELRRPNLERPVELVPRDLPEAQKSLPFFHGKELVKIRHTRRLFAGERLVIGRGAVHDGGHIDSGELQSVARMNRFGLVGYPRFVERAKDPIATSVACEQASGSISAMSRGSQADNELVGVDVAKIRNRLAPILFRLEAGTLFSRDFFAPFHQSWASPAADDLLIQLFKWDAKRARFGHDEYTCQYTNMSLMTASASCATAELR